MEPKGVSQLELFSSTTKGAIETKAQTATRSFFCYLRSYERVIITLIGLVITGIVSFSLGIEKGKKLANTKLESIASPKIQKNLSPEKQEVIKPPVVKDVAAENYTIQVASYQSKASAQREVEALRKKGLLPLVLSKGKYTVLCVGKFSNKETARSLLSELKKRYGDCFIRKL